ncbi:unnamed protein product [Nippostrongylus brasiliensis]|uniref:non-specific serine/threonine protein kinase n=1 Tax=Nippostrongylus brasiliensis TaxID=27835 RepID=A0A0N4YED9_NIPBR|nr:unnamed protein product [Nippostrongylus brasiliensis]
MPLGLFGSSSKPQPLTSIDSGGYKERKDAPEKDGRGTVLRLENTTVTIEKKLAEGGFAIVYLVVDKNNRKYALKRQFINDDNKQVDACRREFQIVSSLKGHKNIVSYVDHVLTRNKSGIYDYMLLTAYYKTSVLQLMNDRLSVGQSLRSSEVLAIFCDMCEAVARLHHSVTPIIHRDLKVENILVDERNRAGPPIYVLCDFGSATTKVLSSANYSISFIQDEVEKYTTLSYRSPEMIDLYCGKPIGTKADTWAMGVMLYKLCYFCLPFGESAMAIQNGAFSFPSEPDHPDSLKAIIMAPIVSLAQDKPSTDPAMQATSVQPRLRPKPVISTSKAAFSFLDVAASLKTMDTSEEISPADQTSKFVKSAGVDVAQLPSSSVHPGDLGFTDLESAIPSADVAERRAIPSAPANANPFSQLPHDVFTSAALEESVSSTSSLPMTEKNTAPCYLAHRRNTSDTSQIIRSAFKPYSQWKGAANPLSNQMSLSSTGLDGVSEKDKSAMWNPFMAAPFGSSQTMDDSHFGKCFDELPRKSEKEIDQVHKVEMSKALYVIMDTIGPDLVDSSCDLDRCSIDSSDPFGAAPFVPFTDPLSTEDDVVNESHDGVGSVGSVSDLQERNAHSAESFKDDDSEQDEQRMVARRRFSYENIDGNEESSFDEFNGDCESSQHTDVVGIPSDDDCAGSRPLLEDDALDNDEEEPFDPAASPREADLISGNAAKSLFVDPNLVRQSARKNTNPFLVSTSDDTPKISPVMRTAVESFNWTTECKESFVPDCSNTVLLQNYVPSQPHFDTVACEFAPATLPRQSTPLTAAPRFVPKPPAPPVPTEPPSVTRPPPSMALVAPARPAPLVQHTMATVPIPSSSTVSACPISSRQPSAPEMVEKDVQLHVLPVYRSSVDSYDARPPVLVKPAPPSFIEGPKTPKPKKSKEKEKKRIDLVYSGSEVETDGSEAEMCTSTSSDKTSVTKKKKKTFPLLGSNPSVAPLDLKMSSTSGAVLLKKSSGKKTGAASSSSRKGSGGALNASFVNSSFLSEDLDSPPAQQSLRL